MDRNNEKVQTSMLQTYVFLQVALDKDLLSTKSERKRDTEGQIDRPTLITNRHIDKHKYKP
jgi:hypothetical protein